MFRPTNGEPEGLARRNFLRACVVGVAGGVVLPETACPRVSGIEILGSPAQVDQALETFVALAPALRPVLRLRTISGTERHRNFLSLSSPGSVEDRDDQIVRELIGLIQGPALLTVEIVKPGTRVVTDRGESILIAPFPRGSAGISAGLNHILGCRLLGPNDDPGQLPGVLMEDGMPGMLDSAIILGHELLGHCQAIVRGVFDSTCKGDRFNTNRFAVDRENLVRRRRDPRARRRVLHNWPDDAC
jgi:hypothetical protein